MKTPYIEKSIKKNNTIVIGCAAFLAIGASTMIMSLNSTLTKVISFAAMTPLFTDMIGVGMLNRYNKNYMKDNVWFLDKPFKKLMDKSVKKYLDNSKTTIEKKYKVAFLSLWEKYKEINAKNFFNTNFNELEKELKEKNEIDQLFMLKYLFGEQIETIQKLTGVENTVKKLLLEDSEEAISIAKEVYKEYSHLGMAAKAFLHRENFEELLIIQDFQFSLKDYEDIKTYTRKMKAGDFIHKSNFITSSLSSEKSIDALEKIIENENDKQNLAVLEEYVRGISIKNNLEALADKIKTKISYINMDSKLSVKSTNTTKKRKI